jgi:hypothetical protein
MRNISITLAGIIFLVLLASCQTTQPGITTKHVTRLDAGHTQQGFYYALPRNIITLEVTIVKTNEIPGPFAQYAGKYLSLENVIETPSTKYEISDVNFFTHAEPDPNEFYFIEVDPAINSLSPFSIRLSESGTILSINDNSSDYNLITAGPENNRQGYISAEPAFSHFIENNLQEKIDTIVERVRMDTVTIERKTLRRTWVEKTSEVRAREVAEYILRIRDKKFDMISGFAEITYTREAIEYMNNEMQQMENDYLELFTGITTETETKYRFHFLPEKNENLFADTLFFFSQSRGLHHTPSIESKPAVLKVEKDMTTRQMGVFVLNQNAEVPKGIAYRIPEHAHTTLELENQPLASSRLLISQFGKITNLPPEDYKIVFYPNSGAIKSVERLLPEN